MWRSGIKVAVVDDDPSFASALERRLRASGFEATSIGSAEAFLNSQELRQAECLILDIHLPGMSGLDLQRHLQHLKISTPVIFVTSHDSPAMRAEAEEAGCAAYFPKPIPGPLLVKSIVQAVGHQGPTPSPAQSLVNSAPTNNLLPPDPISNR